MRTKCLVMLTLVASFFVSSFHGIAPGPAEFGDDALQIVQRTCALEVVMAELTVLQLEAPRRDGFDSAAPPPVRNGNPMLACMPPRERPAQDDRATTVQPSPSTSVQ
ncbi:MAG: hypothetical protein IPM12_04665 [Flavobacteriales bacterium]|nr:hypothetical protein [Flavobacteriales bacterium]